MAIVDFCSLCTTKVVRFFNKDIKEIQFIGELDDSKVCEVICDLPTECVGSISISRDSRSGILYVYGDGTLSFIDTPGSKMDEESEYIAFSVFENLERVYFKHNIDFSGMKNYNYVFGACYKLKTVDFGPCSFTAAPHTMDRMFEGCSFLESFNFPIMDYSSLVSIDSMFMKCYTLTYVDFNKVDLTHVKTINKIFSGCYKLKTVDFGGSSFDNLENTAFAFYNCSMLNEIISPSSSKSTVKILKLDGMFENCKDLKYLDLSWIHPNTTSFNRLFDNCYSLCTIENMDEDFFANGTSFEYTFADCSDLKQFPIQLKIYNVVNAQSMFYDCSSLKFLDLSKVGFWHCKNYNSMFFGCESLKTVDFGVRGCYPGEIITATMENMFKDCFELIYVNLCPLNVKIESMNFMFSNCSSLICVDLSEAELLREADRLGNCFENCNKLRYLQLPFTKCDMNMVFNRTFNSCTALTSLDLTGFIVDDSSSCYIEGCDSMESIYVSNITSKTSIENQPYLKDLKDIAIALVDAVPREEVVLCL